MNTRKATKPDNVGEITQLATIGATPLQFTASMDTPTAPKPMTAPMIEWVVDTGQPFIEAINNQVPAANREASMPKTIWSGLIMSESIMPLRMVCVTEPPAR